MSLRTLTRTLTLTSTSNPPPLTTLLLSQEPPLLLPRLPRLIQRPIPRGPRHRPADPPGDEEAKVKERQHRRPPRQLPPLPVSPRCLLQTNRRATPTDRPFHVIIPLRGPAEHGEETDYRKRPRRPNPTRRTRERDPPARLEEVVRGCDLRVQHSTVQHR